MVRTATHISENGSYFSKSNSTTDSVFHIRNLSSVLENIHAGYTFRVFSIQFVTSPKP